MKTPWFKCSVVVVFLVIMGGLYLGGCINPPGGTVYIQDPAGNVNGLAYDKNKDGVPDMVPQTRVVVDPVTSQPVLDPVTKKPKLELVLDAQGKPIMIVDFVPGSGIYKPAETIDTVVPGVLTGVGGLLASTGIGAVLVGIGAAWKLSRFGRIFSNTVMSIQQARQRLKDNPGTAEALKLLDETMDSGQLQMTVDEITKVKAKMGLPSVTESSIPVGTVAVK